MEVPAASAPRLPVALAATLAELRRRLEEQLGDDLTELHLFGSQARGGAHGESDVDVLVVVEHEDRATRDRAIDTATDLGLETGLLLSPTVIGRERFARYRRQERPLVMDALRDGVRF